MKRENSEIMSFKCKIPKLRHDISAGVGALLTFYAYYYSYGVVRYLSLERQFLILLITYIGYCVILRVGMNTVYAFMYPKRVVISQDGAYIRSHGKQIEIVKHGGYKILGKSGIKGMTYVENAVVVRLKVRNATKLVFIDNGDGLAEEKLKSLEV